MSSIRPDAAHSTGLMGDTDTRRGASINKMVATVAGLAFILVGLLGFTITDRFISQDGPELLGLQINHLHNLVHLGLGAVLLAGGLKGHSAARAANLVVGLGYLLVGLLGFVVNDTAVDVIAINNPDNWFHLIVGGLLTAVALLADRDRDGARR